MIFTKERDVLSDLKNCETYYDKEFYSWVRSGVSLDKVIADYSQTNNQHEIIYENVWEHLKSYDRTYYESTNCKLSGMSFSDYVNKKIYEYLFFLDFLYFSSESELLHKENIILESKAESQQGLLDTKFENLLEY